MMTTNKPYLIIVGAGPDQQPLYQKAKALGILTIGIDYNPEAPGLKRCDLPLILSAKHEHEVVLGLRKLHDEGVTFLGVTTLGMEISPIVAKVAAEFGLVGVSQSTAHLTTNKCGRSALLDDAEVPIPRFQIIDEFDDINLQYIPLPIVIKPSDSSGSRGVRRVDRKEDLKEAYEPAKGFSSDGRVLVEELLDGPQISIEGFMVNSKMYVTGFADRNYAPSSPDKPYFIEDGSDSPSVLSKSIIKEAKQVFEWAARELNLANGPCKGDLIVHNGVVKVIEITSRLSGGGFCSRIQPYQNGTDILTATIQWACGMEVDVDRFLKPKFNNGVSHRFYFHNPGTITGIYGLGDAYYSKGVQYLIKQYPFEVGDTLDPVAYINRLLYVVTSADTRELATKHAEDAIAEICVLTE